MNIKSISFHLLLVLTAGSLIRVSTDDITCLFQEYPEEMLYLCTIADIEPNNIVNQIYGNHTIGKNDDHVNLIMHGNEQNLTKFDSAFCQKFKNIEHFDLTYTYIHDIEINSLQDCKKLKNLILRDNKITKLPKNVFSENSKLEALEIASNPIETLHENSFVNQKELKYLVLESNQINFLPANIFKSMANLIDLDLGNNKIVTINPAWFSNLRHLKSLSFSNNKISELPKDVFKGLVHLEELFLRENQLSSINPNSFEHLTSLKNLNIAENQISDIPRNAFTALVNLEELHLYKNRLTTLHADSLGNNRKLKKISVAGNKINAIDENLIETTGIYRINLDANICSQECIEVDNKNEMKRKLKKCFENYQPRPFGNEERELLEQLQQEVKELKNQLPNEGSQKKGFFDKIKDFFG